MKKNDHFGLIGTFDVDNYGDCLFPVIYEHLLKKKFPDAQITYFSPTGVNSNIHHLKSHRSLPASMSDLKSKINDIDHSILIGGETITAGHGLGTYLLPTHTLSHGLRLWLAPLLHAISNNSYFSAHSVGLQALPEEIESQAISLLSNMSDLTVRDNTSYEKLKKRGIYARIGADPVYLISQIYDEKEWDQLARSVLPKELEEKEYLIAQVSAGYLNTHISEWCRQISKISKQYKKPVLLVPICHFLHDYETLKIARKYLVELGTETYLAPKLLNVVKTTALFSKCYGYVGSSLHGGVVAIAFGKFASMLGKEQEGKHNGVAEALGLFNIVAYDLPDLTVTFDNCHRYNMVEICKKAQKQSLKDFSLLLKKLEDKPIPGDTEHLPQLLEEILKFDNQKSASLLHKIKRVIFKFTKNSKIFGKIYFVILNKKRGTL